MISATTSPLISSRRNPLVRRLRALASKEGRENYSLLLLEGTHLLEESLRTHYSPSEIIATESWLKHHVKTVNSISKTIPIQQVTTSVLEAALSTNNPDGVAALFPLDSLPKSPKTVDFVLALVVFFICYGFCYDF